MANTAFEPRRASDFTPFGAIGAHADRLFAPMVARFSAWRTYRATARALNALSDRELEDIGLTREGVHHAAMTGQRG